MGALDGQCDWIIISNFYGKVTINDLDVDDGDDNSNASDRDFKFDKSHQQEWDDNKKTEDSFLSTLDSIKDDTGNEELEFQNEHFDRSRWIDINVGDVDNNNSNEVDKDDVNFAIEQPSADDGNEVEKNIDVDTSDTEGDDNTDIESDADNDVFSSVLLLF